MSAILCELVSHASRIGIVLLPHVYVTCMCVYVNVVACSENFVGPRGSRLLYLLLLLLLLLLLFEGSKSRGEIKYQTFLTLSPAGAEPDLNANSA